VFAKQLGHVFATEEAATASDFVDRQIGFRQLLTYRFKPDLQQEFMRRLSGFAFELTLKIAFAHDTELAASIMLYRFRHMFKKPA